MTTARDICRNALLRLRMIAPGEPFSSADAATGLTRLNDMMHGWKAVGVNIGHTDFVQTDTFQFFVPPDGLSRDALAALSDQGNWDADANTPALASATGTVGQYYRVSVAGSTELDDVSTWSQNERAVFDGVWLKGPSSRQFEQAVTAMLALDLSADYGAELPPAVVKLAQDGWRSLQARFGTAAVDNFDVGIVRTTSHLHPYATTITG